jgi:hypothetical protein
MVYLVRTSEFMGDWDKAWSILSDMIKYVGQNYDQVKDSYLMTNIAGPTDQVHWVLAFDSLADEEKFAFKVFQDPKYMEAMRSTEGLMTAPVDRLYRREG